MATKLKTFDFEQPSSLTMSDKATYPWEKWFDGDIWELTWNEDFYTHPLMMERIVRTRATGKHAKVRLRHVAMNGEPWGKIVFQRTDIEGPDEVKRAERKAKSAATKATKTNGSKKVVPKAPVAKLVPAKKLSKRLPAAAVN